MGNIFEKRSLGFPEEGPNLGPVGLVLSLKFKRRGRTRARPSGGFGEYGWIPKLCI